MGKLFPKNQAGFSIPKHRLITGIILGVAFAFALYSFFYLFRETFRVLSITRHYDLLILTKWQAFYSNLFFAFISTVFGQSVCFSYWFNRPIKTPNLPVRRRVSIMLSLVNIIDYQKVNKVILKKMFFIHTTSNWQKLGVRISRIII